MAKDVPEPSATADASTATSAALDGQEPLSSVLSLDTLLAITQGKP